MDKRLKALGVMALGAFILAFGLYNVHAQSGITEGGILGTTLLLYHFLHISPSISEVVPALSMSCLPLSKLVWSLGTVTLSSYLIGHMTPGKETEP